MNILLASLTKIQKLSLIQLRNQLVQSVVGTLGLRLVNIGLSFTLSIALARFIGTTNYGIYVYTITWVMLLSVVASLGLEKLLVRNISAYRTIADWSLMRGFVRWTGWIALIVAVSLMLLGQFVVWRYFPDMDEATRSTLLIALLMLPLWTSTRLWQSIVQGLGRIVQGQLADFLIRPLVFVMLLVGVYWRWGEKLTASKTMVLQVTASVIGMLIALWLLRQALPKDLETAVPKYQPALWIVSAMPLLLSNILVVADSRADILLLGSMGSAEAVGIYNVAKRLSELVTLVLIAVSISIAPRIAHLYTAGEMQALQKLVTKSSRIIFWATLPLGIGLLLFGSWVLLIWGSEFSTGYTALAILVTGQLINAAMGPVALLLIMTGYERDSALGIGVGLVTNVGLNLLLIPRWGISGAAVATLISAIIWNLLLTIFAYKRLGIYANAFGTTAFKKIGGALR